MRRSLLIVVVTAVTALTLPQAQMRVAPLDLEQGHVALGLSLRQLANTGIFMNATAHPDDENNGLLVMLNRGEGYSTALATATRGNGGQNEIGPELFEALGVLRTEELHAIHRFDGAEQYFTRAVDTGFSFSIEETFEQWGREEILGDFVRLIRTVRPDVVLTLRPDGDGGGQHHQASAVLAAEAFRLAGDPTNYPEQIAEGLRPWQAGKLYVPAPFGGGPPSADDGPPLNINLAVYDHLLGRTYAEIGAEARSMHKCQGMAQLLALPAPATATVHLVESRLPLTNKPVAEQSMFTGIDVTIEGLARFAGPRPPRALTNGLSRIAAAAEEAIENFATEGDPSTLEPLLGGLAEVRGLRAELRGLELSEEARFEIDFRLRQKERDFQQAIVHAAGIRVEALADDGVVVPGQDVEVAVLVANRGVIPVNVANVTIDGFEGDASCVLVPVIAEVGGGPGGAGGREDPAGQPVSSLGRGQVARCSPNVRVPATARITEPYWHREGESGRYVFDEDAPFGLPYRPTPFYVQVTFSLGEGTEDVFHGQPVQYRYAGDVFSGEKRSELLVVPALSVRMTPEIVVMTVVREAPPPAKPAPAPRSRTAKAPPPPPAPPPPTREVRVTVVNATRGATKAVVSLAVPAGWTAAPATADLEFAREDESRTVRFEVRPASVAAVGEHLLEATVRMGAAEFERGLQVIEYPHIRRQHVYRPAEARLKVLDVRVREGLTVGYIMGVGDEVPTAIAQLGAQVVQLTADDLAWGDLSRFHTIVTGVRAYERRPDLRASNTRLLDYVRNGGKLVVQYNKFEFNEAQYGPYAAKVSSDRVTDENAPVRILDPKDPLFTTPNQVTGDVWEGWVQERGLYFMGERDSRYRALVASTDSFANNPGEKTGGLIVANYAKGRWIYVGLGLWRQLPAGVDGAYRLLANLIS
jgi:LmbE family N-acetylglucosaminyl deacetylase